MDFVSAINKQIKITFRIFVKITQGYGAGAGHFAWSLSWR